MKTTYSVLNAICILSLVIIFTSCGGGKASSEKSKKLISKKWTLDTKETRKLAATQAEKTTGITNLEEIELKGDVKSIVDAVSNKVIVFGKDTKDPSKLSYQITFGTPPLTTSVLGYWDWNADETKIIMKEWDSQANKEKEPKTYSVQELTENRLVLMLDEKGFSPEVYVF